KKFAELLSILREAGASTFGVEVIHVPERGFDLRRRGTRSGEDVLDGITGDEHAGAHSIWMQRRSDLRGAAAPVVAGDGEARQPQGVGGSGDGLPNRTL